MRVAVMSDIHGFDFALQTVLADLDRRAAFDEVIVAGDHCLVGPAPERVLDLLSARDFAVLVGNTDRDLVAAASGEWGVAETDYALERIGPQGVSFLASLPFERRVTPPNGRSPDDDLLIVHANPHDLETKMTPEMPDDELRAVLGDVEAAAVAFGHHHVAFMRELDGVLLVDVSAVGNPKDGDLRCKYGIFTWDGGSASWSAEIVRLDYPVQETIGEMRSSGMPDAGGGIEALLRATY